MPASDLPEPRGTVPPRDDGDSKPSAFAASGLGGALTLVIAATVLYVARDIFVPLAIAGLLTFVLSPPMLWLRHHGLGRALSAVAVITLAFIAILGFGSVVVGEVASLSQQVPSYQPNIEAKLQNLRQDVPIDRLIQRSTQLLQELRAELTPPQAMLAPGGNANNSQAPVPVEIQNQTGFLQIIDSYIGPLLKPIALAGLVLVFAIFFLLNRENLRDRFIRLAGAHDLHRTTEMLNDAVERLSRYLWTELVLNAIYGALMALGAFLIGVPNAALWGVMFLVLRFVPYIGTWLAALFPLALSLAIAPGWSAFFETFGLFITVELVTSQALEPWLFGASAGLSPVAVLVAATFWTWLWGPIGLVLSTPLTACLVVIGRYVPALRFFAVLFGNEAPLAAEESFYQRLLAGDDAEATEQAEAFLKSASLAEFFDQIAIPALSMAQEDSERGVLTRNARAEISETSAGYRRESRGRQKRSGGGKRDAAADGRMCRREQRVRRCRGAAAGAAPRRARHRRAHRPGTPLDERAAPHPSGHGRSQQREDHLPLASRQRIAAAAPPAGAALAPPLARRRQDPARPVVGHAACPRRASRGARCDRRYRDLAERGGRAYRRTPFRG